MDKFIKFYLVKRRNEYFAKASLQIIFHPPLKSRLIEKFNPNNDEIITVILK